MLISELSCSDGIERQMKEAEEISSNLVFVSGVSQTTASPPQAIFLITLAWQSRVVITAKHLTIN